MNFDYHAVKQSDIVPYLKKFFDSGAMEIGKKTGKIRINNKVAAVSPWLHNVPFSSPCFYYWEICFHVFGFVHSKCMNCYKVVARPETLEQMMAVVDIQTDMGHRSKCGVEMRDEVPAHYGAYWYNDGLEEGLDTLDRVREEMGKVGIKSVFLKRACTEFENKLGDSRKWEKKPAELEFEQQMDDLFEYDIDHVQPDYAKNHTLRMWTEFAWSRGDMTCTKYIGGPLHPPYATYERTDNET